MQHDLSVAKSGQLRNSYSWLACILLLIGQQLFADIPSQTPQRQPLNEINVLVKDRTSGKTILEQVAQFDPQARSWTHNPAVELPYATFQKITIEIPSRQEEELAVHVDFLLSGAENPQRRVLIDLKAYDGQDRLIGQEWELQDDQRISAREHDALSKTGDVPIDIHRFTASNVNSSKLQIPAACAGQVRKVAIELEELFPPRYDHLPRVPRSLDLTVTRPDSLGNFEISFRHPADLEPLDLNKLGLCVWMDVYDPKTKKFDRISDPVTKLQDVFDGKRYHFSERIDPQVIQHIRITATFYTVQTNGWSFGKWLAGTEEHSYSGIWISTGGKFDEIPYADQQFGRLQTALNTK